MTFPCNNFYSFYFVTKSDILKPLFFTVSKHCGSGLKNYFVVVTIGWIFSKVRLKLVRIGILLRIFASIKLNPERLLWTTLFWPKYTAEAVCEPTLFIVTETGLKSLSKQEDLIFLESLDVTCFESPVKTCQKFGYFQNRIQ